MGPKSIRLCFSCCLLMLIALLVTACGNQGTTTTTGSTAVITAIATPNPIPMKTQQSCPAQGSGRAAVMPALTTPQHQSVTYLWQDNTHVTLSKYDTTTHKKQNLLTFSMAHNIVTANISPDGHWIVVNQSTDGQTDALKLIRVDGKYTQTLYCAKGNNELSGVLLSPDQHYLVFNERDINTMTDTLKLLDLTTGKIRTVLSSQQPGYPGATTQQQVAGGTPTQASRQQPQVQMSFASQLMPLSGPPPMTIYIPLKWASNSSLYLLGMPMVGGSGFLPHFLYQLLDIHKSVAQQSSNLKSFAAQQNQSDCQSYQSYDISTDQTQLICSVNPIMGPNTIIPAVKVKPISGGSWHTIFSTSLSSQVLARASQGQMILFTVNNVATHMAQLYRINTDGTHLKLLTSTPAAEYAFDSYGGGFNSYLPWTNVSHDGKHYAILQTTNNKDSLIIGNIHGGSATTIPVTSNLLTDIVGWTAA